MCLIEKCIFKAPAVLNRMPLLYCYRFSLCKLLKLILSPLTCDVAYRRAIAQVRCAWRAKHCNPFPADFWRWPPAAPQSNYPLPGDPKLPDPV